MIRCSTFRFFAVAAPCPGWLRVGLALVALSGTATLWLNPADVDSALAPVLWLQMFAASSGFTAAAARGHFDPVLVGGRARPRIALASFASSSSHGLAAWGVLLLAAIVLGSGGRALAPHRTLALLVVSSVAWSLGIALPRLAAGALWSMVLLALALAHESLVGAMGFIRTAPDTLPQVIQVSAACFVCPFLLLSDFAGTRAPAVLLLLGLASAGLACAAASYLSLRDYALEDPA